MEIEKAIKCYEGDVEEYKDDALFGDPKLYVSLNALFFPFIKNESIKVKEGKTLNPEIITRYSEIVGENGLCEKLFLAAKECSETTCECVVYRVERYLDFKDCLSAGETIAFTSTSKNGFLKEYSDKKGLVLMEIHIPKKLPCIDFGNVLDFYKKKNEEEILLMPHTKLTFEEVPLSEDEKQITDADGKPPRAKYVVYANGLNDVVVKNNKFPDSLLDESVKFVNMINATKGWVKYKYAMTYSELKKYFRNEINKRFCEIFQKQD